VSQGPLTDEERALLRRRRERLRAVAREEREDVAVAVARLTIGDEIFAISMSQLRAVVPLRLVTPVPLAPASVIGVLRFDGQVVTAYSLAALLGVRGWRHDPEVLVVVETPRGGLAALDCEQVPVADTVPFATLASSAPGIAWTEVARADGSVLHWIDLAKLFGAR
jgi:purine-binding chemotaxis protein CheW